MYIDSYQCIYYKSSNKKETQICPNSRSSRKLEIKSNAPPITDYLQVMNSAAKGLNFVQRTIDCNAPAASGRIRNKIPVDNNHKHVIVSKNDKPCGEV